LASTVKPIWSSTMSAARRAALRGWPNKRATITRFSRPVKDGSTAAAWPARPITRLDPLRVSGGVDARNPKLAGIRTEQGGHRLDEGGLAGAVRTQNGRDVA
jgi:hypothetical protein